MRRAMFFALTAALATGCAETWGQEWEIEGPWLADLVDESAGELWYVDMVLSPGGHVNYDLYDHNSRKSSDGRFRFDGDSLEIELYGRNSTGWLFPRYELVGEGIPGWVQGELRTVQRDEDFESVGVYWMFRP